MSQNLEIQLRKPIMAFFLYNIEITAESISEKQLATVQTGLDRPQWEESMPQCIDSGIESMPQWASGRVCGQKSEEAEERAQKGMQPGYSVTQERTGRKRKLKES